MKILNIILVITGLSAIGASAQEKLEQDRKAIKSLAGFYKVNFNYGEVTAPDPNYIFSKPYKSHGNEWAEIIVDEPKRIVIQHLLAINDSTVIKHWRQDWTYEDPEIMLYTQDNAWKKGNLTAADVKGKWTQKVFQVDDSPRYQGYGTWSHIGGHDSWSSEADSPLPRRESTVRKDYNVLNRGSRITITTNGWMFEQDNKKIVRTPQGDKLLAIEKGYEEFTTIDTAKFAYAQKWWASQKTYWADVRDVWADVIKANPTSLKVDTRANGKLLYETLFTLGDESVKEKWNTAQNKEKVKAALQPYLVK
ncbi:hypothetical protein EZ449_01035 [Pedobacter frigidisoli]|uniref:Uncharacterized protein n=1 Tax=Pedobacter frigidisoli TaxID=2530455 RepID=A0A4R0P6T1_9SPHI|nr:DUF6607 family protein [Pedobacter frigidisoli]TCD12659.1 hypothetical protein EZ449_01035 [Pedobacter frigidisoli]